MPTIFAYCKIFAVGFVAAVLALHPQIVTKKFALAQSALPAQVVQQGQQLADLEKRVAMLEQANLSVQIAIIQSELSIDHQLLMGVLIMMVTLAGESIWRIATNRKKEV